MKILNKLSAVICMAGLLLLGGVSMTSCDEEISTNQYTGGISLNVFGPSPVLRGGEIRFLGSGMNQVTAVVFPGGTEVTEITVVSDTEIRVTVPQTAEEGYITLKTPNGDIVTKTKLTYLEPISIESFSPASVRPGDELTITGDYLNLMHAVVFEGTEADVTVPEEQFIEHTRQTIRLTVPEMAITGRIAVSDAAEEGIPNLMYAEGELTVIVPSEEKMEVSGITEGSESRIGDKIEVIGQDLNQVKEIRMSNGELIDFDIEEISAPASEAAQVKSRAEDVSVGKWYKITFVIPENASSGEVVMVTVSKVEIVFMTLTLAEPEITTELQPVKPGTEITLAGTNLDLVDNVTFPNVEEPVIPVINQEGTELKVTMPETAASGDMQLHAGGNVVIVPVVTVKSAITSLSPESIQGGNELTINGTDLDLVASVLFGEQEASVSNPNENSLTVTVPSTLTAGEVSVRLKMKNGEISEESKVLTVLVSPVTTIWEGNHDTGDWANGIELTSSTLANAEVNDVLRVTFTTQDVENTNWQVVLREMDDDWSTISTIDLSQGDTSRDIEFTQDMLDVVRTFNRIQLTGKYITITKVELVKEDVTTIN